MREKCRSLVVSAKGSCRKNPGYEIIPPVETDVVIINAARRSIDEITFHGKNASHGNTIIRLTTCYTSALEERIVCLELAGLPICTVMYLWEPIYRPP